MKDKSNILTTKGYFNRFYWHLQNGCSSHKEAYEKVEEDRRSINAPRKYSDYSSFRFNKNYHLVKKGRL